MEGPDTGLTIIVPIAADLAYDEDNEVVCGPMTARACDEAIRVARAVEGPCTILVTATKDPAFRRTLMAQLMGKYIAERAPELQIHLEEAKTLDTLGEVLAVVEHLKKYKSAGTRIKQVIFVVKQHHYDRLFFLVRNSFGHHRADVFYSFDCHYIEASRVERMRRDAYEIVAMLKARTKLKAMGYT